MNCGMARMMRKTTVTRFCCGLSPPNHNSTRLVGMAIDSVRHVTPLVRRPSPEAVYVER